MSVEMSLGEELRAGLEYLLDRVSIEDQKAMRCLEIELALSRDEFEGIPLGPALTDRLSSSILRSSVDTSIQGRIREWVALAVHSFLPVGASHGGRGDGPGLEKGGILVALISNRGYHRRWVPKVVTCLRPETCRVLTDDERLRELLPQETWASKWSHMPPVDMKRWRGMFRKVSARWDAVIRDLRDIPRPVGTALKHALLAASQRVVQYRAFLERMGPEAILVEYDRNTRGAALVLAARGMGIPTYTMIHGVINGPFGYTPIVADFVLCWGEIQRRQLIEFGTAEHRVRVVGFERIEETPGVEGIVVRRKLGIPRDSTVVVLATNPIDETNARRLVEIFCKGVSRLEGVEGMVRLHPSETLGDYRWAMESWPHVRFTFNDLLSPEEMFASVDLVVVHSSGFGVEALAHGVPCVILDVLSSPLGFGRVLLESARIPGFRDSGSFRSFLVAFRNRGELRRELQENAVRFSGDMFAARGERACRNIGAAVLEGVASGVVVGDGGQYPRECS